MLALVLKSESGKSIAFVGSRGQRRVHLSRIGDLLSTLHTFRRSLLNPRGRVEKIFVF